MRQKLQNASRFLLQNLTVLLQNAAVITNCNSTKANTNFKSYIKESFYEDLVRNLC